MAGLDRESMASQARKLGETALSNLVTVIGTGVLLVLSGIGAKMAASSDREWVIYFLVCLVVLSLSFFTIVHGLRRLFPVELPHPIVPETVAPQDVAPQDVPRAVYNFPDTVIGKPLRGMAIIPSDDPLVPIFAAKSNVQADSMRFVIQIAPSSYTGEVGRPESILVLTTPDVIRHKELSVPFIVKDEKEELYWGIHSDDSKHVIQQGKTIGVMILMSDGGREELRYPFVAVRRGNQIDFVQGGDLSP